MLNILTVCTGNICRSPLAEHSLRQHLADLDVTVTSAGTRARDGMTMPRPAADTATAMGIVGPLDSEHRARLLRPHLLEDVDLALALTREHRRDIVELSPALLRKTFTVREFSRLAEGVSDAELLSSIGAGVGDVRPEEAMSVLLAVLAGRRGLIEPPRTPLDDDVIDPFGHSADVYAQTARELEQSLPAIVRLVRLAFRGASRH